MRRMDGWLKARAWYVFLFSIFFILFNLREIDYFVAWKELPVPFFGLMVGGGFLVWVLKLIFRSAAKSGIVVLCLMFLFLLYSEFYFMINTPSEIRVQNRFLTLFFLLIVGVVCLLLYRTKRDLGGLNRYLNLVLISFCLYEFFWLGEFASRKSNWTDYFSMAEKSHKGASEKFDTTQCDRDIYLVIVDSYSSERSLKKYFKYDNSRFIDTLSRLGFYTAKEARSNYAYTPLSLASLLNYDHLPPFNEEKNAVLRDALAMSMINRSYVAIDLGFYGYEIRNLSLFRLNGVDKLYTYDHLSLPDYSLFSNKLLSKTVFFWYSIRGKVVYQPSLIDEIADSTIAISREKRSHPAFVYAHFPIPHGPFYFDKDGGLLKEKPVDEKKAYLEQLEYANKVVLKMVNGIQRNSGGRSIIIVLGDHGSRFFPGTGEDYTTLSGFYFPDSDSTALYDSISHVNVFRAVYNQYFDGSLPRLEDKQEYWKEKEAD